MRLDFALVLALEDVSQDDALDYVFDICDELMHSGEWDALDRILAAVNVRLLSLSTSIGFLSVTFMAPREKVPSRSRLYDDVCEFVRSTEPERLQSLMKGLK